MIKLQVRLTRIPTGMDFGAQVKVPSRTIELLCIRSFTSSDVLVFLGPLALESCKKFPFQRAHHSKKCSVFKTEKINFNLLLSRIRNGPQTTTELCNRSSLNSRANALAPNNSSERRKTERCAQRRRLSKWHSTRSLSSGVVKLH